MSSYTKVLVTGGAGFIGSNLIKQLNANNPDLIIKSLDNYFTGSKDNHIESSNIEYLYGCTTEILTNKKLMSFDPDVVFHLGEYSRIVKSFEDIDKCYKFNSQGTFSVIQYCHQKNAKLIYAASSSKFGNEGKDEHLSPYAWFKAKNIELIKNYSSWYDLNYAITYFYNVYGPGQIMKGDYAAVIGIFQQQVLDHKKITVVSPGFQKRDFTHVNDIVKGVIAASEKGHGDGYLLGTGKNYTLLEIAEAFDHPYVLIPERKGERFTSQAYPTKSEQELNWKAEHDVIEYIKNWKQIIE